MDSERKTTVTVSWFELKLVFVIYVALAGLASGWIHSAMSRVFTFEFTTAASFFIFALIFYPVWRLWTAGRGRPWPFVPWVVRDLVGSVIVFALAWIASAYS
jgi:hypothetical protein